MAEPRPGANGSHAVPGDGLGEKLKRAVKRLDDWYSTAIGLGGVSDKVRSVTFRHGSAVDDDELDALYHKDGIAARIVDAVPHEALREGFRVTIAIGDDIDEQATRTDADPVAIEARGVGTALGTTGSLNPQPDSAEPSATRLPSRRVLRSRETAAALQRKATGRRARSEALRVAADTSKLVGVALRELNAQEKITEAWVWGRLFGGGIVIVGADDGQAMEQPLDEANINSVKYLHVVDRRYISILQYNGDPLSPSFGDPEVFGVSSDKPGTAVSPLRTVHASRCLVFGGSRTTAWQRALRYGWDAPVLERCYDQLRRYNANIAAVSQLVMDASQGVLRIKDLHGIIASGQGAALQERIEIMDRTRSVLRSILLDMDEDFHREATSFAGLEDVIRQSELDVAASIGWPVTFLFGRAPAGLNATGESDYRTILDLIRGEQVNTLKSRVERLVKILLLSKDGPTGGVEPDNWDVVFNPLRQPTPIESAEIRKATAEADAFWIQQGVPVESVLRAHFRPEGFVAELELDVEAVLAEMEERSAEKLAHAAEDTEGEETVAAEKTAQDEAAAAEERTAAEARRATELEESRLIAESIKARRERRETAVRQESVHALAAPSGPDEGTAVAALSPERLAMARKVTPATNPPAWVDDEGTWERAKEAVEKYWDRYSEPYAVVTYVYEQMGGGFK